MLRQESNAGSINETTAVSALCDDVASVTEYHVLVKDSQEDNAAQSCPPSFQYEFWYTVDNGSTTSCGSQNELWDVCTDSTKMEFDYSMCSTQIAYSIGGIVQCVATLTTGNYTLTTVMNTDTSAATMFTCFMSEETLSGTLQVSQSPLSCTSGQTPDTQPEHQDGTKGLLLELTPHATSACDPTTTTSTTTTSTTTSTTMTTSKTSTTSTTTSTTTTTPTTTTTTPTTYSTTSTTTTTPTTTTATPTTTATSSTTSTTASTTTTTTTTTTPATTTTSSPDDNTLTMIAVILGGVAVFLNIMLIVGVIVIVYTLCRRKRLTTPEPIRESTPLSTIERMLISL